jgi:hypothetical protein
MIRKKLFSLLIGLSSLAATEGHSSMQLKVEDMQLLDKLKRDMPPVVYLGPLSIANLNLNNQGSVIAALPGQKIFGMLNFSYDSQGLQPQALHQIVIGFSEVGAQKCIFNEMGYRCGEGITSFFLKVPEEPGLYDVLCNFTNKASTKEALAGWDGKKDAEMMTIGKILVKDVSYSDIGEMR